MANKHNRRAGNGPGLAPQLISGPPVQQGRTIEALDARKIMPVGQITDKSLQGFSALPDDYLDRNGSHRMNICGRELDLIDFCDELQGAVGQSRFAGHKLSTHERGMVIGQMFSQSQFPYAVDHILQRLVVEALPTATGVWSDIVPFGPVLPDLRKGEVYRFEGMDTPMAEIGFRESAPTDGLVEVKYECEVARFGRSIQVWFDMLVNDDLGIFTDMPGKLARAVRYTTDYKISKRLMTTTGWITNISVQADAASTNGVSNLTLTPDNLTTAFIAMSKYTTPTTGTPTIINPNLLVVPPALKFEALRIRNMAYAQRSPGATSGNQMVVNGGDFLPVFDILVDPWMPYTVTSGTIADTMWALMDTSHTVVDRRKVRGLEEPEILYRINAGTSPNGGFVPRSYDNQAIEFMLHFIEGYSDRFSSADKSRALYLSNGQ